MDWTDGILITQSRVQRVPAEECKIAALSAECYPEANSPVALENYTSFGYNWTHVGSPLSRPFKWHSAEDLGLDPNGEKIPSHGIVAAVGAWRLRNCNPAVLLNNASA